MIKLKWMPCKPVSFPKLTQSRLVSIQIHGQNELDWMSFWKNKTKQTKQKNKQTNKKNNACLQNSHCVCGWGQGGGNGGMCLWVWGLYGGHWVWGWICQGGLVCCFRVWVGMVCEFWTSGIVY